MRPALLILLALTACGDPGPRIVSVIDGDSAHLSDGRILRAVGYDAPELHGHCPAEKDLAQQAKRLFQVALEREIRLEIVAKHEKYGRVLARVFVDNLDLADIMVNAGLAHRYEGGKRGSWCP